MLLSLVACCQLSFLQRNIVWENHNMSRRKYDLRSSNNACIYISLSTEINVKKPLYLMFVNQARETSPSNDPGGGGEGGGGIKLVKEDIKSSK